MQAAARAAGSSAYLFVHPLIQRGSLVLQIRDQGLLTLTETALSLYKQHTACLSVCSRRLVCSRDTPPACNCDMSCCRSPACRLYQGHGLTACTLTARKPPSPHSICAGTCRLDTGSGHMGTERLALPATRCRLYAAEHRAAHLPILFLCILVHGTRAPIIATCIVFSCRAAPV